MKASFIDVDAVGGGGMDQKSERIFSLVLEDGNGTIEDFVVDGIEKRVRSKMNLFNRVEVP